MCNCMYLEEQELPFEFSLFTGKFLIWFTWILKISVIHHQLLRGLEIF